MLTRHAITKRADNAGVDAAVVERDYVLAHVVAQLSHARPADGGRLVFKGGTALRYVHMEGYRYSADLDFTILGGTSEAALAALAVVLNAAKAHAGMPHLHLSTGDPLEIEYVGPLGSDRRRKIKVDLATDEHVAEVVRLPMSAVWSDLPDPAPFDVYPIEEIGAEKLRCIIQRVQCRDLYDLHRLTDDGGLDLGAIRPLFEAKCSVKSIDPGTFPERLADRIGRYRPRWATEMGEHVADFPRFDDVERMVRRRLRQAGLLSE